MIRESLPSSGDLMDSDSPAQEEGSLPTVLTVDELASLLRINRDTIYKAISEGQIPAVSKIRRLIRISRDGVLELF